MKAKGSVEAEVSSLALVYLAFVAIAMNYLGPLIGGAFSVTPVQLTLGLGSSISMVGYFWWIDRKPARVAGRQFWHALVLMALFGLYQRQNMEPGTSWLLSLLVVIYAQERLPLGLRLLAQGLSLGLCIWSMVQRGAGRGSLIAYGLSVSSAYVFVAVYVQANVKNKKLRTRAEELAAELGAANAQLRSYYNQAEELATVKERNRLARELHDSLGHRLTVVNVHLQTLDQLSKRDKLDPQLLDENVSTAVEATKDAMVMLKASVGGLRQGPLEGMDLPRALEDLVAQSTSKTLPVHLQVQGQWHSQWNGPVGLALYRVAEEGINNSLKHSAAPSVHLLLVLHYPGTIILEVWDQGRGCDQLVGGYGLRGLQERLAQLGGELEVDTGINQGFRLRAEIPSAAGESPRKSA